MKETVTQFGFNVEGLILAGGQGRRLGGQDKGLVKYRGQPLIRHAIARFAPQVSRLALNVNRNRDAYGQLGYRLLSDDGGLPGGMFQGPLAGIQAGLNACEVAWLACIPCDLPGIPLNLVQRLTHKVGEHSAVYAHDGRRGHYLCCLLSASLKLQLRDFLLQGGRAVHDWFEGIGAVAVDFSDCANAFFNVNSEQDLSDSAIRIEDERS